MGILPSGLVQGPFDSHRPLFFPTSQVCWPDPDQLVLLTRDLLPTSPAKAGLSCNSFNKHLESPPQQGGQEGSSSEDCRLSDPQPQRQELLMKVCVLRPVAEGRDGQTGVPHYYCDTVQHLTPQNSQQGL